MNDELLTIPHYTWQAKLETGTPWASHQVELMFIKLTDAESECAQEHQLRIQLEADLAALRAENEAMREANRWIPRSVPALDGTFIEAWDAEERLPFGCGAAYFNSTTYYGLTHWRPLPQPPEEV